MKWTWRSLIAKPEPKLSREWRLPSAVVDELETLIPGRVVVWHLPDGGEVAVMPADDFRHIAELARLKIREHG